MSKLPLHIEQISLRMTWRLADQLFYKKGYKERTTQSQVGGEDKWSRPDPHPYCMTQKRREYHKLKDPPWEARGSSPILSTPALGSGTGRWVPLAGWKTSGAYQRTVRNRDPTLEEHTDRFACSRPQSRGSIPGKDTVHAHFRSSSPTKATKGTCRLHRDAHKDMPSRSG